MEASEEWVLVAQFPDAVSAQVVIGRLQSERVPVRVRCSSPMPGLDIQSDVEVPSEYAHRARWLLSTCSFTDAELNFLATGELSQDDQ